MVLILLIFVTACAKNTRFDNVDMYQICNPIYGYASDWDVISDELARNIYRHNRLCEDIGNDY